LPSESDLESSGGIDFNVENSKVHIPYASIKHQMETEGEKLLSITKSTATESLGIHSLCYILYGVLKWNLYFVKIIKH